MRILLVEDNPKLAGTLEEALGQAGFTVDCVHGASPASRRTRWCVLTWIQNRTVPIGSRTESV